MYSVLSLPTILQYFIELSNLKKNRTFYVFPKDIIQDFFFGGEIKASSNSIFFFRQIMFHK